MFSLDVLLLNISIISNEKVIASLTFASVHACMYCTYVCALTTRLFEIEKIYNPGTFYILQTLGPVIVSTDMLSIRSVTLR